MEIQCNWTRKQILVLKKCRGLEKIKVSMCIFKSWNYFNMSAKILESCVMREVLQKMRDMNTTVQHIHIVYLNLRQWKSSAVENNNVVSSGMDKTDGRKKMRKMVLSCIFFLILTWMHEAVLKNATSCMKCVKDARCKHNS